MKTEIALWIMAGSLLALAGCALAYVALRISDELRFRRALDGVEHRENGSIVISRREIRKTKPGRSGNYRRIRAQEWIDKRTEAAKK